MSLSKSAAAGEGTPVVNPETGEIITDPVLAFAVTLWGPPIEIRPHARPLDAR
jgi:hypothetical protein